MKTWALGAVAMVGSVVTLMACGSSNTTGGVGGSTSSHTTVTASHTSSVTTGSGGAGGGAAMDAICTDPNATPPTNCVPCINALPSTDPCIATFSTACKGDPGCLSYAKCVTACVNAGSDGGAAGAGGGGAGCVAGDMTGDAGSPKNNCIHCCQNANMAGVNTYVTDLLNACVCTAGAPCEAACK